MAKFKVAIEEHLVREITVEAADDEEAMQKVIDDWKNERIVLDADDFARAFIAGIEPVYTEWKEIV